MNWGSILLIAMGTQWYILFNVIAGAMAIPSDLKEAACTYGLRGWPLWVTLILPAIFPFWVTGACTAAGGAWNASIVAEVARCGVPWSGGWITGRWWHSSASFVVALTWTAPSDGSPPASSVNHGMCEARGVLLLWKIGFLGLQKAIPVTLLICFYNENQQWHPLQ